MTIEEFEELIFSFSGMEKKPHFQRIGYKVIGKRMIATYLAKDHTVNIFLTAEQQEEFCNLDAKHIYPVPNKWGKNGATTFSIEHLRSEHVMAALEAAYQNVVNK